MSRSPFFSGGSVYTVDPKRPVAVAGPACAATDLVGRRNGRPGGRLERVAYCTARIDGATNPSGHADQDAVGDRAIPVAAWHYARRTSPPGPACAQSLAPDTPRAGRLRTRSAMRGAAEAVISDDHFA